MPPRNKILQLSTPYTSLSPQTPHPWNLEILLITDHFIYVATNMGYYCCRGNH